MIPQTPSRLFGPIFTAVQESGLFPDSKTFADAVPIGPIAPILADWHAAKPSDPDALKAFVARHFLIPSANFESLSGKAPLRDQIDALWPLLTRAQPDSAPVSSEIALPHPFLVPGGRFRELYYWDSYFTMLGLVGSGRQHLVEDMIANLGSLLDRFGHIPNGTRSYYLSRSHPPLFYLIAELSQDKSDAARAQRLKWMRIEHQFWMDGADRLAPGEEHRRVVRLRDGALLNRYWDDESRPRDESWREDVELASGLPEDQRAALWRDIRAACESGWDFSSRWLKDGRTLATIRTTRILPIDLNCLLVGLERAIGREATALGDAETAERFGAMAEARTQAIHAYHWNPAMGCHFDYDIDAACTRDQLTAATSFALFTGVCSAEQAVLTVKALEHLLRTGGLLTTLSKTGQQWDAPNGWAPLQWIAEQGLRRYGLMDFAEAIRSRWIATVEGAYDASGFFLEKYDVESGGGGSGGEYRTEIGFGWTNGVMTDFLARSSAE